MSRDLTTKGLSRRLSAEYSARRPFRHRLYMASGLAVAVLGVIWFALDRVGPHNSLLQPGLVASVHRTVAKDCTACHTPMKSTPESKCQECHTTPGHNVTAQQGLKLPVPKCYECHLEHRSGMRAPPPSDSRCAQCHHDLKKYNPNETLLYKDGITQFVGPHPEFAIMQKEKQDQAQLKFNHKFHLDKKTRDASIGVVDEQWKRLVAQFRKDQGIERGPEEADSLNCTDCHTMDATGKLIQPIKYEKSCKSCHVLAYDLEQRATGETNPDRLPHDTPDAIHQHLVAMFTLQRQRLDAANADQKPTPAKLRQAVDWVNNRVTGVENSLVASGKCAQCHIVETKPDSTGQALGARMTVAPTDIRSKWFPHAQFSHVQHRTMACESCHNTAPTSSDTADLNLPRLKDCQSCHSPQAGARSDCVECHKYHDDKDRVRNQGKIRDLPTGTGTQVPPAAH